ncbi:MAG: beta-lactamase family protein [Proteobacteria bacterium]|nr:beta-lactamase family protein [Pseudomonadota bacterium]
MTNTAIEIQGHCDERFSAVKDAFAKNFSSGLEVGASFAATVEGESVIDIWAGHADADRTKAWEKDTIVNVYSTTKFMTAVCVLMLVDRGQLDLDAPVSKYWPEFAQAGKENLPVRYLLSHTSGLAGFGEPITPETLYDWDRIVEILAAQEPMWKPGTASGYHSLTFGYPLGELVRRITGKTIGTFFREEVATPLNADFHIGLPEKLDSRVGELIPPPPPSPNDPTVEPGSVAAKVMSNPVLSAEESKTRAWRAAEIPAANGHGNARSVARVAAAMACGGELDGVRLLSTPTLEKAIEEQHYDTDLVLAIPIRWGLGFGLASQEVPFPNQRSFYWGGWGGSMVAVDPDAKMSMAYVMNKMEQSLTGDERIAGLSLAMFTSM